MLDLFYPLREGILMKKLTMFLLACFVFGACAGVSVDKSTEYLAKGEMYHKIGRAQKALKYLNKAIAEDPSNAQAYLSRGSLFYSVGEYDNAIADFNLVLEADKNVPELYSALGAAYAAKGEYKEGREALLKSLELYPNNVAALNSLGGIYYSTENYNAAIEQYSKALELRPVQGIFYMRGVCYEKLGMQEKAADDFAKADFLAGVSAQ